MIERMHREKFPILECFTLEVKHHQMGTAKEFALLAEHLVRTLKWDSDELPMALVHLLKARDCAMRSLNDI